MPCNTNIICVEWSAPADALTIIDRYRASRKMAFQDPACAYVVERDGEPLYVGGTNTGIGYRMHAHSQNKASPLYGLLADSRLGIGPRLMVRWVVTPLGFACRMEGQIHRSIQAPFNRIDRFWRNVPLLPDRSAA